VRGWMVDIPGPIGGGPLVPTERPDPVPGAGQARVRVSCCGVCRTDLHLVVGDLPPRRHGVVPGHEVVGVVDAVGPGATRLTAQVALAQGLRVHVLTRGEHNRRLARELGCDSVGGSADEPPERLDGAILFAPAGDLVPIALRALDRGGTLAVAGIWLSDIPSLSYDRELFHERTLRSVTANTRSDGEEFLRLAQRLGVRATTVGYSMDDAGTALADLASGSFGGAAVLHVPGGPSAGPAPQLVPSTRGDSP
jgi:D-arabinose 1-dehydrogenase-like Zn-dependent alcohol dehydrogenase